MKIFQELLMKDLGWKLLSVAIAAIMWFMVINITQPVDTRNYNRPLVIENMDALTDRGLTVGNLEELKNTKITVKVKAQRTALDRLNQNPEWIEASVNLAELSYAVNGDTVALPVNVSVQGGNTYGVSSKSPAVVEISVETLATKELPIEVNLIGSLEDGTYLSEPTLSAETVKISGPASLVNRIVSVQAIIDAEAIKKNPTVHTELVCYDSSGQIVAGVTTSVEEIVVSYALHDMKQVPIQVEITGTPAKGYQVGDIYCSPQYATLTGTEDALKELVYLQLDSIDVSGRTASVTQTFSLEDYLPEGISLTEDAASHVRVTVDITEQSQRQLTLSSEKISLIGGEDGKTYDIKGDAHLTITGKNLDSVRAETLRGTIHVSGLSDGDHRVMVHVDLPDGIIMNPAYITVNVGTEDVPENE